VIIDTSGTFDVAVTKTGCSGGSANAVEVTVNASPTATITEVSSSGGKAMLQAGPAGASYQWLHQLTPNAPYTLQPGTSQNDTVGCGNIGEYYTVVVTQNGCSDTSAKLTVVCVGISDLASRLEFHLMPNPASDVLNVSYDLNTTSHVEISVLDLTGRKVMEVINATEGSGRQLHAINLADITSGIYLLNFSTELGTINTKFIKQ
jgi:hypothetical protein